MRKRFFILLLCCIVLLPAAVSAKGEELLPQGAFENTQELPQDWFQEAWLTASDEYAILMDGARDAVCINNYVENDARLCYTLKVKRNKCYMLSCDIRTQDVSDGQGANVSVNGTMAASAPLLGTNDWQRVSLIGKTGKKQTEMTVCVRVGGYGALSSGAAWFRDISLVEVDNTAGAADFSPAEVESEEDISAGKVPHFGAILLCCLLSAAAFSLYSYAVIDRPQEPSPIRDKAALGVLLCAAFLLRILLSRIIYGHPTDINCFMAWGNAVAENGIAAFYTSGMFADYPPGYMYVLGLMSKLAGVMGFEYASDAYSLMIKLPAILCDLASAYFIYRIAKQKGFCEKNSLCLSGLIAFNPLMMFISAGWGQIDSVLTLLIVLAFWLFTEKRIVVAGAVYGLAILVKPQALMMGPIFAAAYFCEIKNKKDALRTLLSVITALAVILLLSLPFKSTQETGWLLNKYFSTATSYPYASIEAYNLMALLGGNWKNVDEKLLFVSYRTLGTILMCVSVALSCFVYVKTRKKKGALWLCAAYMLCALFMFGQYMHERYLFPILLLLLMAFLDTKDKRVFTLFAFFTVTMLFNTAGAFVIIDHPDGRALQYSMMTMAGSALQLGGFAYFSYTLYKSLIKQDIMPAFTDGGEKEARLLPEPLEEQPKGRFSGRLFERRDRWLCWGLTAVYAIVALCNLGTLKAPQTAWTAHTGDEAVIDFGREVRLSKIFVYGGIAEGQLQFVPDEGEPLAYSQSYDDMFRWIPLSFEHETRSIRCDVTGEEVVLHELAFFDEDGQLLEAGSDYSVLTDEQATVPAEPSFFNGMYFDELYHGRTAYEHLHGMAPYENSHPPLGKILIMTGIAIFGMSPFGWRIVGCLFGIFMLPIMYAFAKRLFKKSEYAFLSAALFACDFMHFTQTRIATIDVYAVFFIILMYDFMYQYACTDFLRDGVKKTLKPLALAGVFFGLGAASKWTCIYAGGGLALILLLHLLRLYRENGKLPDGEDKKKYWRGTVQTLLFCCLFYIVIPAVIYVLSYIPYMLSVEHYDLKGIWGVQEFIFSYHSGLKATHPYQSAWWQWPLDLRPTWYYVGYDAAGTRAGTISAFGNPLVWWVCSAGMLILLIMLFTRELSYKRENGVLACAAVANYLPWVLVPRCTFAYHYFPMVPFIILASVYIIQRLDALRPEYQRWKWAWLGMCLLLFVLFYPVISGKMVSVEYIKALEWLPGWTFLGY